MKFLKQYWWVFLIISIMAAFIGESQTQSKRENLKQEEVHRIQQVLEHKKQYLLSKATNSYVVNSKDIVTGEYYIINADGSYQIKKIDGFDTKNLSYDKKVNDTMVDDWYKKEEDKISETVKDAEEQFTSDQKVARETYNNLKTAEERVDMVQYNKTFQFSVLNGTKNKSNDWFFFGTNIVSVYYNKKTDVKLVDEMISELLKKLDEDQKELYDKIQFLEVSKVNQFELEDVRYDGNVKVVITDVKKEWRKVIDIDNANRFIDAMEFFKNPINKK